MLNEFKKFILRGNVIDLAIGVIIGGAFGKIVSSFVNDIIMPPIGLLLGKMSFSSLFIDLSGKGFASLEEAKAAAAPTLNYGLFFQTIIDFIIIAIVIFFVIKAINRLAPPKPVEAPATKECPRCFSAIPVKATRCPNCTSEL